VASLENLAKGLEIHRGNVGPGVNHAILQGTFAAPNLWIYAAIAVLGIVLGAAYMLWLYQRVMFGKLDNPANQSLPAYIEQTGMPERFVDQGPA
jgi:NADH-quinone oxidoreductase subunit M